MRGCTWWRLRWCHIEAATILYTTVVLQVIALFRKRAENNSNENRVLYMAVVVVELRVERG